MKTNIKSLDALRVDFDAFHAAESALYRRCESELANVLQHLADEVDASAQTGSEIVGATLGLLHGTGTPMLVVPESVQLLAHNGQTLTVQVDPDLRADLALIATALYECCRCQLALFKGEAIYVDLRTGQISKPL